MKIIITLAVGIALAGCQPTEPQAKNQPAETPSTSAVGKPVTENQQFAVTVDNGFSPNSLDVKAGQPVEITFDTKQRGCATQVSFKELGITKDLTDGQKTVVSFTPEKAGEYTFACPMNMFKGKVVVK